MDNRSLGNILDAVEMERTDNIADILELRRQNDELMKEVEGYQNEVQQLKDTNRKLETSLSITQTYSLRTDLQQALQELNSNKDVIQAMKDDRKQLRAEKVDLLSQLQHLYTVLEDKETELRDFIRNYQKKVEESSQIIKELTEQNESLENQKWELTTKAHEATERCISLKLELDKKTSELRQLKNLSNQTSSQPIISETRISSSSCDSLVKSDDLDSSVKNGDELPPYQESYPTPPRNILRRKAEGRGSTRLTPENEKHIRVSVLSQQNYNQKVELLTQAQQMPVTEWKASHVLVWLELALNMSSYSCACAENIKSGKVLLGLSDAELSSALNLESSLHRRKIRLAINDLRNPLAVLFPKASGMDNKWICDYWIESIGLPQYKAAFEAHLVDGRVLNTLAKKDLEKYLGVRKKFHQNTIMCAISLLRLLDFDREILEERIKLSHGGDDFNDPLVWNNQDVCQWLESIDLEAHSDNLQQSGVHGALMVLDKSFTADVFCNMLRIPSSKSYIRRHLATEMDELLRPAREQAEPLMGRRRAGTVGSTGQSELLRSRHGSFRRYDDANRRGFRGSLGRALGKKFSRDMVYYDQPA